MSTQKLPGSALIEVIVGEKGGDPRVQIRVYRLAGWLRSFYMTWEWNGTWERLGAFFSYSPSPLDRLLSEVNTLNPSNQYLAEHGFSSTHTQKPLFPGEVLVRAVDGQVQEVADIRIEAANLFRKAFTYNWP